ncbi:MAG: protein YiiM [Dehalococcoidales bacterium]|nr:protein YiiM [Dehalococcoidales bacterium]
MARIIAVCQSEAKGTRKEDIHEGYLQPEYGLTGDAHAGSGRQVSLIAMESINKMRQLGFDVGPGDFAENLTTEGIDMLSLPVGTELRVGQEVVLEITQIGKECHSGCAIFHEIGKCIMPKEGIFARVVRGGLVRSGDEIGTSKDGK